MAGISEGEVAVYDRQLRLWGVQAQQRLLKAKVLVWGLEGSNIEVCKNLVLAGVSLTVRDHRQVAESDVAFNYFLRGEDLGQGRAEATARRLQEMNPLCSVEASSATSEAFSASDFKGYLAVCAAPGVLGWSAASMFSLNSACRAAGAGFFLTLAAGQSAMLFTDLLKHTVKEWSPPQGAAADAEAPVKPEETIEFPSLQEWAACTIADMDEAKVDPAFQLFQRLITFLGTEKAPLEGSAATRFATAASDCSAEASSSVGVKSASEFYTLALIEPLAHVSSILGGLLAQEVVKFITQRDAPLVNTVLFCAPLCAALVDIIPPVSAAKKKRKAEVVETLDLDSD